MQEALTILHQELSVCRLCVEAGYDIHPRAIHSGEYGARAMIIGQAPGVTEVEAGRPFNAGSGKRLFDWIGAAGMDETWFRENQYITAVTKCFPGKAKSGSGDRMPSRNEQKNCRPYLDREIEIIDPAVILPVGKLAIGVFYHDGETLTEIIGTEKTVDGRKVIPLPHPSGASRWHQSRENRLLIDQAIVLMDQAFEQLFSGEDGWRVPKQNSLI